MGANPVPGMREASTYEIWLCKPMGEIVYALRNEDKSRRTVSDSPVPNSYLRSAEAKLIFRVSSNPFMLKMAIHKLSKILGPKGLRRTSTEDRAGSNRACKVLYL